MKKFYTLVLLLMVSSFSFGATIASDGLNNATTLLTPSGGAYYTGNSAAGDAPASSPFASEGTHSRGISNGTGTLTSGDINTVGYTGIQMTLKLASFSIGGTGNGADPGDSVWVEISPNGGTNWWNTVRIQGPAANNAYWSYTGGSGNASAVYDGNASPTNYQPAGGGSRTADGYGTITITGLPASSNLRVRISFKNNSTSERWVVDDFQLTGTPSSSLSGLTAGAGAEPASLPSTTTALSGAVSPQTNAIMNFDFIATDDANTTSGNDALPTLITQIVIPQGTGNDIADWTQAIQGAELSDGTNTLTGTVAATTLTFTSIPTGSGALGNISDNGTKTYTLKIWLKTALGGALPTTIDGLNLAFKIDRTNFTTASSATSTQFESGAGTVVESGSTNNAVAVVAYKLNFVVQPTNVNQNATMSPSVTISVNDPNGNRDLNNTANVLLASTGTMTGDPITVAASAGLATYSGIVHTVSGAGLVLTGTSSGLTATGNSNTFNVIALSPEINLQGNATSIVDGDITPTTTDHTDFGSVAWGATFTRTYTIQNTGSSTLTISGSTPFVAITGANASEFVVTTPPSNSIAPGGSTTFVVTFTPAGTGTRSATITINNNDADEAAYDYAIQGTGTSSSNSDIVLSGMVYTSNIDYTLYQAPAALTNTTGNVGVMGITIRDGGATSPDNDGFPTILNSITFSGITGTSMIRTAALFEGNAMIANTPTINVGANTIAFSGLSYSCTDNSTRDLTLRVSFLTTVTDNLQMTFNVANTNVTTASSATSSQMSAFTTVNSIITGDRNRIEVVATKLLFVQQPTNTAISVGMAPAVTVRATDVNNNTDLDFTGSVSITSTGTLTGSPVAATAVSGLATFSGLTHTVAQTGRQLTATSTGLTSATSTNFDITTVVYTNGDYRTTGSGNWVSNLASPAIWERLISGVWTTNNSPTNTTNNTVYIRNGHTITTGVSFGNTVNIVIESGGVFTVNHPSTTGSIKVKTGGILNVNAALINNGNFEIESGGICNFAYNTNSVVALTTTLWNGTEIFRPGSIFNVLDLPENGSFFFINSDAEVSTNLDPVTGLSACFGYLNIDMSASLSATSFSLFSTGINRYITHNDFVFKSSNAIPTYRLSSTGTNTLGVGGDFIIEPTFVSQLNQTTSGQVTLNINGSFKHNGGGEFKVISSASGIAPNKIGIVNIEKDLIIKDGGIVRLNGSTGSSIVFGTINLKGDLSVDATSQFYSSANTPAALATNYGLNFTGTGDGLTDATTQTISVVPTVTAIPMNIKAGAYVKLKDYDLVLNGTTLATANFTVEPSATLDFSFNTSNTPLVIKKVTTSAVGTNNFISQQGCTLKITAPDGINLASGTTGATGQALNVQMTTANTISPLATFWYMGKVPQHTGTCIGTSSNGRQVIVDLLDNNTSLTPDVQFGLTDDNVLSPTGGKLDIRKGQFLETTSSYIDGSTGTLYMAAGTLYRITKGYAAPLVTPTLSTDLIPRMSGSNIVGVINPYILSGGTIELAGTGSSNAFQTLRGGKNYQSLKFSGANTYVYPTNSTYTYKNLSSNVDVEISVEVTNGAVVDCIDANPQLNPVSFTGNGGLIMKDPGSRFRIKNKSTKQPELKGSTLDYNLENGTVEFYGTDATEQQNMRGNEEGADLDRILYYNVDINANTANYSTPPAVVTIAKAGNVDAVESFGVAGNFNVYSPASFRLDETDYIEGTGNVIINSGAGLLYGSANGIKTTGTGVSDGNIRISGTRTFSTGASYGFVGNGGMVSGSGLPSQVVGLYVYKNTAGDLVTLTNSVEAKNLLKFQNGIIKTDANLVNVSNSATTAIVGGALTGTDKYVQGNLQRNTDGASSYTFPIGHASQNAQGFTIGVTGANNSTIKGFLETNNQTLVHGIAYCDIEKHSGTAGVEHAGQGVSGYDGILDKIEFDLHSPLQWDVVNPSGGITSYDITVAANGGQDINPVVSSNSLPIRYLMKNGEPGNTGVGTSTGAPSFSTTGFLKCPNGYTLSGMTSFSKFTVDGASEDNTVLPIELIYFDAECTKEGFVNINWSTASEINNDYYTIERSTNATTFESIIEVDAVGNSGNINFYNNKDENPVLGTSYYRLKQTDLDGSISYSKIVRVDCTTGGDESINVFYADGEGIVSTIFINNGERFKFSIYDDLGRIIFEENRNIGEGFSRNLLNNKDLATGIYFVTAQSENKRVSVKLFVP